MRQSVATAWRAGGRAWVAACVAAVIAVFPATVSAATPSWTILPSPNPGSTDYSLADVTCVGAGACWAVGWNNGGAGPTLIEHNTGGGWVIVTAPTPTGGSVLQGVTCVSASDCWAVGYHVGVSTGLATLIEHYDGISWTIVSSPNPGINENLLRAVACLSISNCWAVGASNNGSAGSALIEQYNGTSWFVVPNSGNAALDDVTCQGLVGECWAVGISLAVPCAAPVNGCALIERNIGKGWVIVSSPNIPTASSTILTGVTCVSATNCWAVGDYQNSHGKGATLTEHYDGSGWTIVASPNVGFRGSVLLDVSCAAASDCWAVGYRVSKISTGSVVDRTLIEQDTGGGWVVVSSPNVTTQDNLLGSVKCVATHACWAVGNTSTATSRQTLVEHHG